MTFKTKDFRGSRIELRKNHLIQNFHGFKKIVGSGFLCPMVKANAYGHDARFVVQTLAKEGATHFGVATLDEALEIKGEAGSAEILIFSRFFKDTVSEALKNGFIPVLSRFEDLAEFESQARASGKTHKVHIKIDTGIHRMGFDASELPKLKTALESLKNLKVDGVLTHMSHGEDAADSKGYTEKQIQNFLKSRSAVGLDGVTTHLLNSAALLSRSLNHSDVPALGGRPGIGLYGGIPDSRLAPYPVMRVVSRIDQLRHLKKGEGVSYGWTWRAQKDSVVAVVPVGYADGYLRNLSNKAQMLLSGQRIPVIGTVCMDYCLVDVTDLNTNKPVQIGDEVVVLGEQGQDQITAAELGTAAGSVAYEILTGFGRSNRMEVDFED